MKKTEPFVIAISRQLGSGGAYIGQQLAKNLDIEYVDREILRLAAKQLTVMEEDLASRDEKLLSFWNSFFHINGYSADYHLPPQMNFPFDREIYDAQSDIIKQIASDRSAVIIGRCGFHILREYSNSISVFLHADISFRRKRVQELYNLTEKAAMEMITQNDRERARYIDTFTGKKWTDAMQFDLTIDTGKIGFDKSAELILSYLTSI